MGSGSVTALMTYEHPLALIGRRRAPTDLLSECSARRESRQTPWRRILRKRSRVVDPRSDEHAEAGESDCLTLRDLGDNGFEEVAHQERYLSLVQAAHLGRMLDAVMQRLSVFCAREKRNLNHRAIVPSTHCVRYPEGWLPIWRNSDGIPQRENALASWN